MEKGKGFTQAELAQFTGTKHRYRHPIAKNVRYTDGILFVAEQAAAYWLIDEIVLAQRGEPALKGEEFRMDADGGEHGGNPVVR